MEISILFFFEPFPNVNYDLLVCFRTQKHSFSYDSNKILRLIILVFLDNIL